jgi:hypothetical protein
MEREAFRLQQSLADVRFLARDWLGHPKFLAVSLVGHQVRQKIRLCGTSPPKPRRSISASRPIDGVIGLPACG